MSRAAALLSAVFSYGTEKHVMKIEQLYSPGLSSVHLDDSLADAAARMYRDEISALPVVDDNDDLVGIISERDMTRALADNVDPETVRVSAYAAESVALATPDDDSGEVADRMLNAGIRHLPVVTHGHLAGIVSMRDLLAVHMWT